MKIQPLSISGETLGYIGHGQLESSPASMSVLHVVGHELDHVAEFRNEAIRDNAEIRSIEMKIDYEFQNGKLVAVSGKTTATTQKKPTKEKSESPELELDKRDDKKNENDLRESGKNKISQEERNLLFRLEYVKSEISNLDNKGYYTDREPKDIQDKKEERKKEALNEKKRKIEAELANFRTKTQIEKSQEFLQALLKESQNNSFRFLKAEYAPKLGSALDITI